MRPSPFVPSRIAAAVAAATAAAAALVTAFTAAPAIAADSKTVTDWDSLVQTEEAFSSLAQRQGLRSAFLAYFADDALTFPAGAPTRTGTAYLKEAGAEIDSGTLAWHPVFVVVASSGELGYTSGPWTFRASKTPQEQPAAYGVYVTIWRRPDTNGAWKVISDFGAPRPSGPLVANEPATRNGYRKAAEQQKPLPTGDAIRAAAVKDLLARDTEFGTLAASKGFGPALQGWTSPQIQAYSYRHPPAIGERAANRAAQDILGVKDWRPERADAAMSGDLGYTVGTATLTYRPISAGLPGEVQPVKYERIWYRSAPAQPWQIVLEIMNTAGPALQAIARPPETDSVHQPQQTGQ